MTKAPERIWAHTEYDEDGEAFIEFLSDEPWPGEDVGVEYTRTDLSDAMIAAAYEAAADACAQEFADHMTATLCGVPVNSPRREAAANMAERLLHQIRALTPADARAALERVAQPRWYRMDDPENPPPKDGTRFMAFEGSREAKRYECWWNEDGFSNWDGWLDDWDTNPEPTHWTPLLAPPEDEG